MVVEHYMRGAAYPVGGSARIAATMIPGIESAGGAVITSAEVGSIRVEGGRVTGVQLTDGFQYDAPMVISDAGWAMTGKLLTPAEAGSAGIHPLLPDVGPSAAHVCLYVGAHGDATELGLDRSNLWIYPGPDHDAQFARYCADPGAPLPLVFISFPSAKDPDFGRRHPGKSTIEVVGLAPYQWFARWEDTRWKKRGEEYDQFKARLADRLIEVLLRECPKLRGRIEHAELSTPLSTRNFAAHPRGEIYGLSCVPARFALRELRPRTGIPGLYLTGADVCTPGVAGALMGGVLTASFVARQNLLGVARAHATRTHVAPAAAA
jgi:all-trans-retinol 13,14-reductase